MSNLFFQENSVWPFILISVIIGGWFAWMTGRAMALTWRSYLATIPCLFITTIGVRFLHFAIFQGTFLSLHYYFVDLVIAIVIGSLGYRFTRTRMMTRQYRWLYERTSPFTWRAKNSAI
ncbi:DUF6867 family protein [Microvirga sp. W0021]|uniref:DUF6867 family protein n=1 Tax=Hohaiivirga grylli TaxID=3133970 RepID=A0ABV0BLK4_9HYPH